MRNGSERTTLLTGRSANPVKLAVVSAPIAVNRMILGKARELSAFLLLKKQKSRLISLVMKEMVDIDDTGLYNIFLLW